MTHTIRMKNVVIVGGSSGIGLAVIQNLKDCSVTNISRTPCPVAGVNNISADVTDKAAVKKAFASADQIDTLIYCAGASLAAPTELVSDKDMRKVFDVNFFGAIDCIKCALPGLSKSDDAHIVIISSAAGVAPIAYDSVYSASKAGLLSLASALRLELPEIKSTAVVVGGVRTQFSFKRKIYTDCGDYNEQLKKASDSLIRIEQTGYAADFIAKKIIAVINKKNPPPVVTVGAKNKLMLFCYKMLPWRLKLYALRKTYNLQ